MEKVFVSIPPSGLRTNTWTGNKETFYNKHVAIPHGGLGTLALERLFYEEPLVSPSHTVGLELNVNHVYLFSVLSSPSHAVGLEPKQLRRRPERN